MEFLEAPFIELFKEPRSVIKKRLCTKRERKRIVRSFLRLWRRSPWKIDSTWMNQEWMTMKWLKMAMLLRERGMRCRKEESQNVPNDFYFCLFSCEESLDCFLYFWRIYPQWDLLKMVRKLFQRSLEGCAYADLGQCKFSSTKASDGILSETTDRMLILTPLFSRSQPAWTTMGDPQKENPKKKENHGSRKSHSNKFSRNGTT